MANGPLMVYFEFTHNWTPHSPQFINVYIAEREGRGFIIFVYTIYVYSVQSFAYRDCCAGRRPHIYVHLKYFFCISYSLSFDGNNAAKGWMVS